MTTKRRKPRAQQPATYYTMVDELLASATQPMPERNRTHQLRRMADALHELMHAPQPGTNAWRVVSDAVNLLETLVQHGEAPIKDATEAVDAAAKSLQAARPVDLEWQFSRDFVPHINLMAGHGDPDYLKKNGMSIRHVDLRQSKSRKATKAPPL